MKENQMINIFITGESGVIPQAIQKIARHPAYSEYLKILNDQILDPRKLQIVKQHQSFEIRQREIDFTDRIADPKQLIPAIEETTKNPDALKEQRELASEKFLYKLDGNATQRIILAMDKKLKN